MRFLLIFCILVASTPLQIECLFDNIQEKLEKQIESNFEDKLRHGEYQEKYSNLQDDGYLTTMELCNKNGYACEAHYVETPDGYIIELHRIVGRINGTSASASAGSSSPTVLVAHGIFGSSSLLVLNGEDSAGGILSDYGYDVWLGNSRGNRYGLSHRNLSRDDPEFWKFNYNEMCVNDYSAILDYILRHVDKESLHCVGYSQGGILLGSLLAINPSLNSKVKSLSLVASAFTLRPFKSKIFHKMMNVAQRYEISRPGILDNPYELFPYTTENVKRAYKFCNKNAMTYKICRYLYSDVNGYDDESLSELKRFPYYVAQYLNGASSNAVIHFSQCYFQQKLCLFDYGPEKNPLVYGQATVPEFDYSLVTSPKIFIYGSEDHIITEEAVKATLAITVNIDRVVKIQDFNHMHFMHGYNIKEKVYDIVAEHINHYE